MKITAITARAPAGIAGAAIATVAANFAAVES